MRLYWIYSIMACLLLSGCAHHICNILPLPQEHRYPNVADYIRTQRIYDQFQSVMSCVVLWCSEDITALHDQWYYERTGTPYRKAHPHALILMMPYHNNCQLQTNNRRGTWGITLQQENAIVPTYSVHRTSLDAEYRYIMGRYYNHFYNVYAVTFTTQPQKPFTITVQSPLYAAHMHWTHID